MSQFTEIRLELLAVQWHDINSKIERTEATLNRIFTKPTPADIIKLLKGRPIDAIKIKLAKSLETLDKIEYMMSKHTAYLPIITKMNVTPRFSYFTRGE
jgi:hypothetical protein